MATRIGGYSVHRCAFPVKRSCIVSQINQGLEVSRKRSFSEKYVSTSRVSITADMRESLLLTVATLPAGLGTRSYTSRPGVHVRPFLESCLPGCEVHCRAYILYPSVTSMLRASDMRHIFRVEKF